MDLEVRAAEFLHDLTAHTARAARLVLSLHRLPGRTADHGNGGKVIAASYTALKKAVRSAQFVAEKLAFSMLQP